MKRARERAAGILLQVHAAASSTGQLSCECQGAVSGVATETEGSASEEMEMVLALQHCVWLVRGGCHGLPAGDSPGAAPRAVTEDTSGSVCAHVFPQKVLECW